MTRLTPGHLTLLVAALYLTLMAGCSPRALQTGPLSDGLFVAPLPGLKGDGPVAWHPSGTLLAAGTNGLFLLDTGTGTGTGSVTPLDSADPAAVTWSPDGSRLAVAWRQGESTRLELWSMAGERLTETSLPGSPDRLLWSAESGLLIITTQLKTYSFGGDLLLQLHRWDGQKRPDTVSLHNNTIKPATAEAWLQERFSASRAALSPAGDELLYLQLHDPPAFSSNYRLTLRHIASGAEKQIASLPFSTRTAQFIDEERILVDAGSTESTELFLWSNERADTWPYAGGPLAISPGGRYWMVGGHLLRDGEEIGHMPDLEQALFSPDGSRLLLQSDGNWHILAGLADRPTPAINTADLEKLRQLRDWRSRGLITPEEFRQQQQRMTSP